MPVLPHDIHMSVIEAVYRSSQSHFIDYTTLRACALVCRAWAPIAQRLLFRRGLQHWDYWYPEDRAPQLFLDALAQNPSLGAHVRSLTFFVVSRARSPLPTVEGFIAVLQRCPNLARLTFRADREFAVKELERIRDLKLNVKVLLSAVWTGRANMQLLALWSGSIRYTSVCVTHEKPLEAGPPPPLLQGEVPITLHGIDIQKNLGLRMIDVLFPSLDHRAPELRYLKADGLCAASLDQIDVIATNATFFRTVVGVNHLPEGVFALMTGLEEVILLQTPRPTLKLPRSIRHLGLHPTSGDHMMHCEVERIFDFMRNLPELQLVSLTRLVEQWTIDLFRDTCAEMGIDLIVYEDWQSFHRPEYVDWIG
ncbi:hypothetical protein FA95DRAFT_1291786 [Auriscalpium vulgare]|uniref:Uncharacterized protein n=1 Tax=Auriscalpium vulgare TaxID=40419 RepID=A0ACB8RT74_9AGAM|nr:hypothetical protein FA95DRAFT_1291786 [Auriscalpium vulgare]